MNKYIPFLLSLIGANIALAQTSIDWSQYKGTSQKAISFSEVDSALFLNYSGRYKLSALSKDNSKKPEDGTEEYFILSVLKSIKIGQVPKLAPSKLTSFVKRDSSMILKPAMKISCFIKGNRYAFIKYELIGKGLKQYETVTLVKEAAGWVFSEPVAEANLLFQLTSKMKAAAFSDIFYASQNDAEILAFKDKVKSKDSGVLVDILVAELNLLKTNNPTLYKKLCDN